jgi:hypothetical protein
MAQDKQITLDQIAQGIDKGLNTADEQRASAFDRLQYVRRAKSTSLQKEQARLSAKYGTDHPRVQTLGNKVVLNEGLWANVVAETIRAKTEIPVVDARTWVLHGYVRLKDGGGVPNLTVGLYDDQGEWVQALGHACTAPNGYFRIKSTSNILSDNIPVYVRVLNHQAEHLYADQKALRPAAGHLDYREIVLTGEGQVCAPPGTSRNEPLARSDAWIVRGRVTDSQGKPLANHIVTLYDKDLFFDDELGQTETDERGQYYLVYNTSDFRDIIERKPDIYLKILDEHEEPVYTLKRPVRFEAGRVEIINVRVERKG